MWEEWDNQAEGRDSWFRRPIRLQGWYTRAALNITHEKNGTQL